MTVIFCIRLLRFREGGEIGHKLHLYPKFYKHVILFVWVLLFGCDCLVLEFKYLNFSANNLIYRKGDFDFHYWGCILFY